MREKFAGRSRTPAETAIDHILRKEWDQLPATAEAWIEPIVELAMNEGRDDEIRRTAASALEIAVEQFHAELPERILRYLWNLGDVVRVQEEVGAEIKQYIYSWTVMPICIRQELELRDLARRGVDAMIEKLEQNGWNARTLIEVVVYHVVRGEWDQLAVMGEAGIVPLAMATTSHSTRLEDETRRAAAKALEAAVEKSCADLPVKTLRFLLNLPDVVRVEKQAGGASKAPKEIYAWTMKSRLRQELERRGLR
ncbi:MAG TPA: hypothetical protein VJA94_15310 [Candidatus Angelobacter sp.]